MDERGSGGGVSIVRLRLSTSTTVNELIFARLHSVALMVQFRVASEGGVFVSARSAVFVFGSAAKP